MDDREYRKSAEHHPRAVGERVSEGRVEAEEEAVEARAQRLRAALEDIVALADSAAESRERAILMQRRAIAALAGKDRLAPRPPLREPPGGGSR